MKVTAAWSAGLLAREDVKVRVARLFVELKLTPLPAIVYVPVTPAIVKVSPATGVVYRFPITRVVPDCDPA